MQNRIALVTGASRGMGAATAKLLASNGAAVAVNYFGSEAAAQQVVSDIEAAGGRAIAVRADVHDQQQVEAMVQQVAEQFGAVDTLVINAAGHFEIAPFIHLSWDGFQAKLVDELKAAFFPAKAVVPGMIERQYGSIIAVSTGMSRYPMTGFAALSTAKSGLDAFIKSLALELGAHGIRANLVAPGLTLTDASAVTPQEIKDATANMTPLRRNALPDDIASAILMLASDQARFITGAYVPVSGGLQML
ncbi:MAG TPA: short-chain dehydrogenase [Cyanobacteria bacterium UBA8553]|nr:short-chain dehydrogenase [Cyanobacteria bacterium UBA8553]HAJ59325.1 short-chain dehydrogenase [Cyanobacteria bacterium UBA8543]